MTKITHINPYGPASSARSLYASSLRRDRPSAFAQFANQDELALPEHPLARACSVGGFTLPRSAVHEAGHEHKTPMKNDELTKLYTKDDGLRPYMSRHSLVSWFQVVTPEFTGSRSSLLSLLVPGVEAAEDFNSVGLRSCPNNLHPRDLS
ncbi:hypothetical protein SLEP1_g55052 [Rubroshorea leprosula]|uniref:Uncharacterized protein n=1 Tax=Rubroshorea leprosula TaxID=152421 RepID=A0AAV5MEF4_9ROSI|nr:hypothetical protein SLEP1_g55052 [Rubroshorea leprosula]